MEEVRKEMTVSKLVAVCTDHTYKNKKSFKPSVGMVTKLLLEDEKLELEYFKRNWAKKWLPYPKKWIDILPITSVVLLN